MKKTMKKVMAVFMILAVTAVMMMGCGNDNGTDGETVRVGILQLTEHPSLDTIRESIIEGLADEGYVDGENITIDYKNGQNDMTNMKTIAQAFVADKCDVIVAIATPAIPIRNTATNTISSTVLTTADTTRK